jgi:hypothetical protein
MSERKDIDWVAALSACSVGAVFEELKQQVRRDVESRNKLRSEYAHYVFRFIPEGDTFVVLIEGMKIHRTVTFFCRENAIIVQRSKGTPEIEATLTLNDEGECRVKIDGQERELWQMRKMALEELFFHSY